MEEWELRLEVSYNPVDHLLIFTSFFGCGRSKGHYFCLTTLVNHFPYLSYSPVGCGVPFPVFKTPISEYIEIEIEEP